MPLLPGRRFSVMNAEIDDDVRSPNKVVLPIQLFNNNIGSFHTGNCSAP